MKRKKRPTIKDCGCRSACPLTNTLDIIGDKWTLIIIRDMLFIGKKQYGDFLESPEDISTNILADRLKRLEEYGIVTKKAYQSNPERHEYFLTGAGLALQPVIMEIVGWGLKHIEGTQAPTEKELKNMQKRYSGNKTSV